jgi:hypothetical protein
MKMTIPAAAFSAIVVAALFLLAPAARGAAGTPSPFVTFSSLLQEMTDREAAAEWPIPAYTLKQASSHDRRKNDPGNAEAWHSNTDYGQFIRTEVNEGRREWVIMEDGGPGAITRFWAPLLADKDKQTIRFYFDGSPTPGITAKLNELLSGRAFVRPPLAFIAWNETDLRDQLKPEFTPRRGVAGDLYLPIPFAKGCKITLDSVPFYYVINYRSYESSTTVQTFTMDLFAASKATLDRFGERLLVTPTVSHDGKQATIAPGQELSLDLPTGPAAVHTVQVWTEPLALRSTVLQATFDDEMTAWCPVGEFFGAGTRLHPVQDWWRTVATNGTLTARWVMPFHGSARLALKNVGDKPVTAKLAVATGAWTWDERSLYFHANWHGQLGLKTRPISDWNYIEVQGQGRYVGDTLTVFSPVKEWYGEGDERIYYDGATFPAHIGTGTEDYYGYAWGMAGYFNSPFISMPKRDRAGQDDWRGYTTTSRLRVLDAIPFRTALRHDMEIWNWADTQVDYAVGTFWYARPGARHNRTPQQQEAARPVLDDPGDFQIAGAIECETMKVLSKSDGLAHSTQSAYPFTVGSWSGGSQLFVQAKKPGDFIEVLMADKVDGPRKVTLYATKSYDYGMLALSINGKRVEKDFDGYAPQPALSGPVELGVFEPRDGHIVLRVEVVGTNTASKAPHYYFGLDALVLSAP